MPFGRFAERRFFWMVYLACDWIELAVKAITVQAI